MIFSHLLRASLSSFLRKFSINLLSFRLRSTDVSITLFPSNRIVVISFEDLELFAKPRGLEQISQTTLADEFSYVQAGQCQTLTGIVTEVFGPTLCRFVIFVVFPIMTPVLCLCDERKNKNAMMIKCEKKEDVVYLWNSTRSGSIIFW